MFNKRLLKLFSDTKNKIAGIVITQWVTLIANILFMAGLAMFFGALVSGESVHKWSGMFTMLVLIVLIIRCIMTKLGTRLSFEVSNTVKIRFRKMVFEKFVRLGSHRKASVNTAEAVQLSTDGTEQMEVYFGKYIPQFIYSMAAPITLFVIVAFINIRIAIVLLICVPLIPASIVAVQKFAKKMLAKYWGSYVEMGDSFLESLYALTTLKIYKADKNYAKKMDEQAEKFRKITMKVLIMQLNSVSIMDLVAYGGAGVGIIMSIFALRSGEISFAQAFFIIMIAADFFLPLRLLGSYFHIAMNGNAAADKLFRILDLPEKEEKDTEIDFNNIEIRLENVNFGYDDERLILDNINITLKKGITAIAGESGCGKSTIVSLLMKEYDINSGSILFGDTNIEDIATARLYQNITRISNNSYVFAGTIEDNLRMGNRSATQNELWRALEMADLKDFVISNGGLKLEICEDASNISGGQRQRLALARAILHDSPVYIFDEATSNVDVESENVIMSAVRKLAKDKIVLIISHRLANIENADTIYYLNDGKIIESGSHDRLMTNDGDKTYRKLFEQQKALENIRKVVS